MECRRVLFRSSVQVVMEWPKLHRLQARVIVEGKVPVEDLALLEVYGIFIQAEDCIGDYKVTGVQTCALPIPSPRRSPTASPFRTTRTSERRSRRRPTRRGGTRAPRAGGRQDRTPGSPQRIQRAQSRQKRSEESRVGKEGRYRWLQYPKKKKEK